MSGLFDVSKEIILVTGASQDGRAEQHPSRHAVGGARFP
jgi:hypothetical protein